MLDEKNNSVLFEEEMAEFLQIFWRQGNIKKELVEEILDRMKASNQKNVEDVLTQLYFSTIEAKNVNLRVIGLKSREENEICCFMGPSDNEFISFLSRYKQKWQGWLSEKLRHRQFSTHYRPGGLRFQSGDIQRRDQEEKSEEKRYHPIHLLRIHAKDREIQERGRSRFGLPLHEARVVAASGLFQLGLEFGHIAPITQENTRLKRTDRAVTLVYRQV